MAVRDDNRHEEFAQRLTICFSGPVPGIAIHAGEDDFRSSLSKHYKAAESNVAERLVHFKHELSVLDGEAFWSKLMNGMTDICRAQFAFVSKRILVDDDKTAVEMPAIGEVGSCLMAVAIYFNDGSGIEGALNDYKYYAWSAPCAYMKHDKVFLIPEKLTTFIQDNPNNLPFEVESYLGIPLFAEGKCYAHFGMMWTKEGLEGISNLSWGFIEMFMHSLEDLISSRLLAGQGLAKSETNAHTEVPKIIPQSAITATQSLKLYARSLSHELRTPMQGVVGMLDLMYATVQEQIESSSNVTTRKVFQTLKESIEVVQDSSKRAVEAADNVVQAYDMDMKVPDSPGQETPNTISYFESRPKMMEGSQILVPGKRKRENGPEPKTERPAAKVARLDGDNLTDLAPRSTGGSVIDNTTETTDLHHSQHMSSTSRSPKPLGTITLPDSKTFSSEFETSNVSTPGIRYSNIRDVLPIVINESLRVGGRPDYAVSEAIPNGERTEVKIKSSSGVYSQKVITWHCEDNVPYVVPLDERDLSKIVGAVFLNAVKFTENGTIDINIRLSSNKKYVLINIKDNGSGIPHNFQPELFKPFSKEDGSITRHSEGLGLGLLVAKGLARRTGGDILLVRSETYGPMKGSDFEIRILLDLSEIISRASTPLDGTHERSIPRSAPKASTPVTSPSYVGSRRSSPALGDSPALRKARMSSPESLTPTAKPQITQRQPDKVTEMRSAVAASGHPSSPPRVLLAGKSCHDRSLAEKYPLQFLVAEDNKINRKLLVSMLGKFGYKNVYEAYDGKEAVRIVDDLVFDRKSANPPRENQRAMIDVILMDLWMPEMDGYQATIKILEMFGRSQTNKTISSGSGISTIDRVLGPPPTVLAVSADVTDTAIDKAMQIGMAGYMSKPYKLLDLQKLILEFCIDG